MKMMHLAASFAFLLAFLAVPAWSKPDDSMDNNHNNKRPMIRSRHQTHVHATTTTTMASATAAADHELLLSSRDSLPPIVDSVTLPSTSSQHRVRRSTPPIVPVVVESVVANPSAGGIQAVNHDNNTGGTTKHVPSNRQEPTLQVPTITSWQMKTNNINNSLLNSQPQQQQQQQQQQADIRDQRALQSDTTGLPPDLLLPPAFAPQASPGELQPQAPTKLVPTRAPVPAPTVAPVAPIASWDPNGSSNIPPAFAPQASPGELQQTPINPVPAPSVAPQISTNEPTFPIYTPPKWNVAGPSPPPTPAPTPPPVLVALPNPTVTKSYSTCGAYQQPYCAIEAKAQEMGTPNSGTDCKKYGDLAFYDAKIRKCYVCPIGYTRTSVPVRSDAACVNTAMNWVTDRAPLGLFGMVGMEQIVPKLSTKVMRAVYQAAVQARLGSNSSMLVYELLNNPGESTLLREAIRYHLIEYASANSNTTSKKSGPELTALDFMASYTHYYRMYLAYEAKTMLYDWNRRGDIADPLALVPPVHGMVASSYWFGNGGNTALAVTTSLLIASYIGMGGGNLKASGIVLPAELQAAAHGSINLKAGGGLMEGGISGVTDPTATILATVLVAIQRITTPATSSDAKDAVQQAIRAAQQTYNVDMLISDLSSSKNRKEEFITVFAVAAANSPKPQQPLTTFPSIEVLVRDLCAFDGPFFYESLNICL